MTQKWDNIKSWAKYGVPDFGTCTLQSFTGVATEPEKKEGPWLVDRYPQALITHMGCAGTLFNHYL